MKDVNETIDYYVKNAESFANSTSDLEFSEMQDLFLSELKKGSNILDFGCGSGRDTRYFLRKGYHVTALDGSAELCRIAKEKTGITVTQMEFNDFDEEDQYDGIWNGHHDFRALGAALEPDCLPTIIEMMEDACSGHIVPCEDPSFWGQDIPLRKGQKTENMFAGLPGQPPQKRITLRRGRNWLTIDPDQIRESR